MSQTTAPDLTEVITTQIRDHRKYVTSGSRYISEHRTQKEIAGRFATVGGADVEVQLNIKFDMRWSWATKAEERTVQFSVLAQCQGHGCPNADHQQKPTAEALLEADADETAKPVLPLITAAREWAQAHAEKCRAVRYDAR